MVINTMKAVVHPWQCDAMGHMNVRYYTAIFDDASGHLLSAIAPTCEQSPTSEIGWADVRHVVDFKEEAKWGQLLNVTSSVTKVGRSSLSFRHVMSGAAGEIHATMEIVTVMFDLKLRKPVVLPDDFRQAAERLVVSNASATS
ncbi:acyl-CoA thioesterase (plasmid) [Sinorhizobium garamanticum]|uniref:Acyl-CoA thioesterase n=1 Tax=Sinorhizobium garamanticum TaxID=680247 RepID=A0ABY8DNV2_9HYPH|nr:acyl-CoA thioesterase [Sinorhizobium garamanticum]WEX91632.1 acyl-CoA thioesterase [Sinorhizobium garamanticum]